MKKAITLILLTCWLFLGNGVEKEIASYDELQPGPYEYTTPKITS